MSVAWCGGGIVEWRDGGLVGGGWWVAVDDGSTYSARDSFLASLRLEKLLPVLLPCKANRGGTGRLDDLLLHFTFPADDGWEVITPIAELEVYCCMYSK